ncbi:hypothetical protein L208DRAFT_1262366, partial [Tricholoma matsutake]
KMDKVDTFCTACYIYLHRCTDEFLMEESKVIWLLSFLQGSTALKWCKVAIHESMNGGIPFKTDEIMLDNIEETFRDPNKEDTCIFKITTMVQGEKTVDEHVQDFKITMHELGYTRKP